MTKKGLENKISLSEARQIVLKAAVEMGVEKVALNDAIQRVLAEDVSSKLDNPPFDRAMMDGYALRSVDTRGASENKPKMLRIVGSVEIGGYPDFSLKQGEAVDIMTGAPVPQGADTVLRVEHSKRSGETLEVQEELDPGKDISPRGEDIKTGDFLLSNGTVLKPADIGVLAATGHMRVKVKKHPVVGIISTGSELLNPGEKMKPGSIYDINSYTLFSLVKGIGGLPVLKGIVRDDDSKFKEILRKGDANVFLISGATSVGEKDFVPGVIESLGLISFHGVNIRPGSPVGFGRAKGVPVFMLPGFPVSCITAFELLVTPFLQKMLGTEVKPPHPTIEGFVEKSISIHKNSVNFVRVSIHKKDDKIMVSPLTSKGSSLITSLSSADGFILVEEGKEILKSNEKVTVYLF